MFWVEARRAGASRPHGLGWLAASRPLAALADVGVALLRFTIGLERSIPRLRAVLRPVFGMGDLPGRALAGPGRPEERGEEPRDAVLREIREEIGPLPEPVEIIEEHPGRLVYELPAAARSAKHGRGQAQKWFLLGPEAEDSVIDPRPPRGRLAPAVRAALTVS